MIRCHFSACIVTIAISTVLLLWKCKNTMLLQMTVLTELFLSVMLVLKTGAKHRWCLALPELQSYYITIS